MSALPKPMKQSVSNSQRKFLERWLAMHAFDQAWGANPEGDAVECDDKRSSENPANPEAAAEASERSFDPPVQWGNIRLLPPQLLAEDSGLPRYIAVLDNWDGDMLVCPFAPYSVPAVTGELATGREHFSLAVIQLWNAVIAPKTVLEKTWYVDSLSHQERLDAVDAFRTFIAGTAMPDRLVDRVGAPIRHPEDPRIQYQNEETAIFAELRAECLAKVESVSDAIPFEEFATWFQNFKEVPAAAATGEEFTPCVVLPMDPRTQDVDDVAPGVQHHARVVSFEDIIPGDDMETSCRWEVETSKRDPVGALVYVEGVEPPIGNAAVNVLDDSLEVHLWETDLPKGHAPVSETGLLRIVLLVED